jgi:putative MATE family efflux protein
MKTGGVGVAKVQDLNLIEDSIPYLIRRIAAPASIGFFFNTMYNVVDTYWGGTISTEALAALSLSFPVFFIITAVGSGMSTGATALIGTALGAHQSGDARRLAVQSLTFGLILSLVIGVCGYLISPLVFRFLGAEGLYHRLAVSYMRTIFCGAPLFILVFMLNAVLNAMGNTRVFRNFLIVAFLLNIGLDPWFIHGGLGVPPLGFSGIALATVTVHFIGCVYLGWRVQAAGLIGRMAWRELRPRADLYRDIARQGFPAAINLATIGLGIFVIQYFVAQFGKEGVAAYGIGMRVEQMALLPTIGLNVAVLSLVAQNHGAGRFDRVLEIRIKALFYGAVMMIAGGVLVFALSGPLMRLFTHDELVIRTGAQYLKIDALVLYAYVILFVNVAALQGVKKPNYAIWIGVYRQLAAPVVVFWLLSRVLGLGVVGIWWGIFVVTWSAALFMMFYTPRLLRRFLGYPPLGNHSPPMPESSREP